MTTITGTLLDTLGNPVHCPVQFKSLSTPIVEAGVITANTLRTLRTDPITGAFSIALHAGNYRVTYLTSPVSTSFDIAVPAGNASLDIGSVVSTSLVYTYEPPSTVWNGTRAGHITFQPVAAPGIPAATAAIELEQGNMDVEGAHGGPAYRYAYVTATGETELSPIRVAAGGIMAQPGWAYRLTIPNPGGSVTQVRIYRTLGNVDEGLGIGAAYYHLATVAAGTTTYTDYESQADFTSRVVVPTTQLNPVRLITAAPVTLSGLQILQNIQLLAGDRVAVNAQASDTANGIYVAAAGAWSRSDDFPQDGDMLKGLYFFVTHGTYAGAHYILPADVFPGTNGFNWQVFVPAPILNTTAGELRSSDGIPRARVSSGGFEAIGDLIIPDGLPAFDRGLAVAPLDSVPSLIFRSADTSYAALASPISNGIPCLSSLTWRDGWDVGPGVLAYSSLLGAAGEFTLDKPFSALAVSGNLTLGDASLDTANISYAAQSELNDSFGFRFDGSVVASSLIASTGGLLVDINGEGANQLSITVDTGDNDLKVVFGVSGIITEGYHLTGGDLYLDANAKIYIGGVQVLPTS